MINAIIIDDDLYAIYRLEELISSLYPSKIKILSTFQDPLLALTYLQKNEVDLLLLDIKMPSLSGFELLDLQKKHPAVIFITSSDSYAIKAIRYSAFDYLLKPINENDFKEAINRFLLEKNDKDQRSQFNTLQFNLSQNDDVKYKFFLPTRNGDAVFYTEEIIRCVADSNYTELHLINGKRFMASKTLSEIEALLPEKSFVRVHKSHLINFNQIKGLNILSNHALLSTGEEIPVSRRRLQELKEKLQERY
jgi:two-component system LytT family response regulator